MRYGSVQAEITRRFFLCNDNENQATAMHNRKSLETDILTCSDGRGRH